MTTRLTLNHWQDWLLPGNLDDTRLLHADRCDRILVCPPHLGQGYIQEIPLQDDLSLCIHDYSLNDNLVINTLDESNCLKFESQLAGPKAGYSLFVPHFGLKDVVVKPRQQRFFKVQVIVKPPTLITYFRDCLELFPPRIHSIAEGVIQSIYRHQQGHSASSTTEMLSQILPGARTDQPSKPIAADGNTALEHVLPQTLYSEVIELNYAVQTPLTPAMKQVIGQILSCPYQGATRRAHLQRQALMLVSLHLEARVRQRLSDSDLNCIYQASSILRHQLVTPPTVEALARQVCTNRLKLNQGFHDVYGTTPFHYLRECRLMAAHRLLITSDLPIANIAATVGYANRSHFALAFRQWRGINPKTYQMQAWQ